MYVNTYINVIYNFLYYTEFEVPNSIAHTKAATHPKRSRHCTKGSSTVDSLLCQLLPIYIYIPTWMSPCRGKQQQSTLYEDFLACGGQWKQSSIYKEITNTHVGRKRGVRKRLTRKQLLQHFDSEVVKAIIQRKVSDNELCQSEVRDHPECSKLKQYLTLVEDEEEQLEESKIVDMFKLKETEHNSEGEGEDEESSEEAEEDLYV